jgi:hypothetical protein
MENPPGAPSTAVLEPSRFNTAVTTVLVVDDEPIVRQRGIEVETLPTAEAVRRFHELDPAAIAAALYITC